MRARLIANEPFAVILPDDVIAAEKPCLQQMVEAHAETGGNMVAAMEVPQDRTNAYGMLDVSDDMGALVSVKGLVEKPDPAEAPSTLAVIGRYILTPDTMRRLNRLKQGAGGEIQLTDAIAEQAAPPGGGPWPPVPGPALRLRLQGRVPPGDGRLRLGARRPARRVLGVPAGDGGDGQGRAVAGRGASMACLPQRSCRGLRLDVAFALA